MDSARNTEAGPSSRIEGNSSRRVDNDDSDRSLSPARTIPTPSDPGIQEVNERYRLRGAPSAGPSPTSPVFIDAAESPVVESPRRVTRGQRARDQTDSESAARQTAQGEQPTSQTDESVPSAQGGAFNAIRNALGFPGRGDGRGEEGRGGQTQNDTSAGTGAAAGNALYPDMALQAQTASMDPSPPTTTGTGQGLDERDPPAPRRTSDISMQDAPPSVRNASQPRRRGGSGGGSGNGSGDQAPVPVRRERREGWACDNGTWKQVAAYRPRGSGYQVMLKERAPNRQYWSHEWVAAHLVGGATVVNGYITHMRSRGVDEVDIFRTGSIDLLREMTEDDYEGITGIAPVRRYQHREFGWEKMPAQDIQVKFSGIRDPIWYPKAEVVRQFGRETVEGDIADFWQRSGITPPVMNPPDLIGPRRTNDARRIARNERTLSPTELGPRISRRAVPQHAQQQAQHAQQQAQTRQHRGGIVNRLAARRQDGGLPTPEHTPAPDRPSNLEQTPSSDAEFQTLQSIISRHPEFLDLLQSTRP